MRRDAGFSLTELMGAIGLLAVVFSAVGSVVANVANAGRNVAGYTSDIEQSQRVLDRMRADLRVARSAWRQGSTVCIEGQRIAIYEFRDGSLYRRIGDSGQFLTRCVESMDVNIEQGLARVTVELKPRMRSADKPPAALTMDVWMRGKR